MDAKTLRELLSSINKDKADADQWDKVQAIQTYLWNHREAIAQALEERDALLQSLREVIRDRVTQTNLVSMPPGVRGRVTNAQKLIAAIDAARAQEQGK